MIRYKIVVSVLKEYDLAGDNLDNILTKALEKAIEANPGDDLYIRSCVKVEE